MLKLEDPNLAKLVHNLSEIKELYLDGVNISASGNEWCQALSSSLPNLSVLSMSNCCLLGPLHSSLQKLQSLSVILLDNNNFSASVPEFFSDFRNLTSLRLSSCKLNGNFPDKIYHVPTLKTLDLSSNEQLSGTLLEFHPNNSLRSLVLSRTIFSGTLPVSIGNLTMLSRLDLSNCNFSGSIPKSIANLTQLVYLDMSYNKFNGQIPSFSMAKNLTQINLSHNNLEGSINSTRWEELIKLVNLDLGYNSIGGSIPMSLFSHPSLQKLQLSNNNFSGGLHEFNVSSYPLDTLDLSSNNLGGPLPASVFKLHGLKFLSFSSNKFNGSFQFDEIQQLQNLSNLDLSYNKLSINYTGTASPLSFPNFLTFMLASCNLSTFPDFLRNQFTLNKLDLSQNRIHGEIPNWIWQLNSLVYLNLSHNHFLTLQQEPSQNLSSLLSVLDLHSNKLQGQLPHLPPNVTYLDFSMNNFSSVIPTSIGFSLSSTIFLSLSSNKFQGEMPQSLCNGTYLLVLDLSNNSLSGTIPQCLYAMSESLGVLNLRRNNLNGTISDKFPGKCGLQTLSLNSNLLHGKLPKSLANCTNLEVLDIGNNHIEDVFPCYLRNISSLRVLVLRSNNFYGSIGCDGSNVTWPILQIVDLASNNFTGQFPNKSFSTWKAMMANEDEVQSVLNHLRFEVLQLAVVIAPITFWEKGRKWHDDSIDKILMVILPMMGLSYTGCYNAKVEAEEDIEDENTEDSEDDDDDNEMEDEEIWGRCSIFLSFCIFVVSDHCLEDQKSLLLQFKNGLNFTTTLSTKLVHWNEASDCCSWEGVTCSKGRVIGLNLTKESIYGELVNSSTLFSLQHLQDLSLAYNNFSNSRIPAGFGNLMNLSYLNLSNAGFSGQLPIEISNLKRLVTLDLSTSSLLSFSMLKLENPNLAKLVQNLSEIKELYLDGVNISAPGNEWCQALSSSLPNLSVLSMSSCSLSGPLHSSFQELQSLSVILLHNNNFSAAPVPEFFANFRNLTSLRLSSCGLNGQFPEKIFQVPTLQTLDLSDNKQLSGTLQGFHSNGSLRSLVLSRTNFSGTLPDSIGNLKMLSRIDLSNCSFLGSIPSSMANLVQLFYLDMSSNNFTGPIPSLSMAKKLTQLNISHNNLTGQINFTHWKDLTNVVNLDLRFNSLNGSIPVSLFSLPSLRNLQLSNNQFSSLHNESSNSSSSVLDTLDLSSNKLKGPIPMSLFELQGLKFLSLSSNNFDGSLQLNEIQQLTNLSNLDLSYNNLSIEYNGTNSSSSSFPQMATLKLVSCKLKTFPDFLKNQSKLTILDLSNNQIKQGIPNWIWKLSNLHYLNLSYNYLVMTLEGPLFNLSSLSVLDLRSNQLEGKLSDLPPVATYMDFSMNNSKSAIPASIVKSLNITYFSVSSNKFHGDIPQSLCNATHLQVLNLSNNTLNGTIPPCLIEMSKTLGVLDVRRNKLSGNIADTFPYHCGLQTLNLNGNRLGGVVPRSLVNCTNLEVFDIGNNEISDVFPCHLRSISKLRVLILRSNKFYGHINSCRRSRSNFFWPILQIVDLASNEFTGKLPRKFFSTLKAMHDEEDKVRSMLNYLQFSSHYAVVVAPLTFWEKGRKWHDDCIDKILLVIFPMLGLSYTGCYNTKVEEDEDIGDENTEDCEDNGDEDEMESEEFGGRYCVFCSKLDISRKRVIHDPQCTCHNSPLISASSSTYFIVTSS
nr:receptor-like protein 12 [Quercus suber]